MKARSLRSLRRGERIDVPLAFVWRGPNPGVPPNTWTYFRKEFQWQPGQPTLVLFAADPTARVWVNGELVLARVMRFVSPQITVERLELKPFLKHGRNLVTVLHHFWGVTTFQRSSHDQAGFAFDAKGLIAGAEGWSWRPAAEFLPHLNQTIGGGHGRIRFPVVADLRKQRTDLREWPRKGDGWRAATPTLSPQWAAPILKETMGLERRQAFPRKVMAAGTVKPPSLKDCPVRATPMSWLTKNSHYQLDASRANNLAALCASGLGAADFLAGEDGYVTLDFGKPVHGTLMIEILDAPEGAILDFTFAETRVDLRTGNLMLKEDGSFDPELVCGGPYGDRILLRKGKQSIELPEERTGRWMMITWRKAGGAIRVKSVSMMTSQHPAPGLGRFAAEPPQVKPLVGLGLDHARITMSDTYVDTPGREDAQWLEDIQYRARLAGQWFGDSALRQVTLRHAVEQQRRDGLFRVFAPEEVCEGGITHLDWAMTWIGLLRDDWWWTGSTERVEKYFGAMERFLDALLAHADADGVLAGGLCFSDIRTSTRADVDKGGRESLTNAWMFGFLRQAAEMAEAIGKVKASRDWRGRADKIKKFFPRFRMTLDDGGPTIGEVWAPGSGPASPGQAAVVNTVYHGLAGLKEGRALLVAAFEKPHGTPPPGMHPWNNPTYAYRALRTLCDFGLAKIAGAHFLEMYRPYLPEGPLPEYFLMGEAQQDDPTGSHGWAAVPLVWLHDTVLGIRLATPGGKHLHWQPHDVGWGRVNGRTMTPHGPCEVMLDWTNKQATIKIPRGTSCELRLGSQVATFHASQTPQRLELGSARSKE